MDGTGSHDAARGGGRGLMVVVALVAVAGAGWYLVHSVTTASPRSAEAGGLPSPDGNGHAGAGAAAGAPGDTTKIDAVLNSAQTLARDAEFGKADTVLSAGIAQFPEEQRLYLSRAELLATMKRTDEAYAMYEKALAIGPREGEVEFAAGTVASMCGKPERAVEHYQAAQQKMPRDYRPSLFLAQVQVKLRQTEAAKANLVLAGALNPDAAVIWGTLADLELSANRPALALQHVRKARELEPRVTLWRLIEARALKRDGKAEEALQVMIGVDEAEKMQAPVLALMVECYGMLNRPKDAAALCVKAAEADTGNAELAAQAAAWLTRAGEPERAAAWAERAKLLGGK